VPYPFPKPDKEVALTIGEWWNADTESVINQAMSSGVAPNGSDSHTINGKPGPLFFCPTKDTFALSVEPEKTYLLRIINAALNQEVFFDVENHHLTVVEVDTTYTKPFEMKAIMIAPG
jgi:laccase